MADKYQVLDDVVDSLPPQLADLPVARYVDMGDGTFAPAVAAMAAPDQGSAAFSIVSDADGHLFWCKSSGNGTGVTYEPLPGYPDVVSFPVSPLDGQQLANAKAQYAVQLMTSDGANPTNAVKRVYSTLYVASAAGVGYSVGDILRCDETYTYATGTWAAEWLNLTTNTPPIPAPASMSSVSATTGRIITSHTDSQQVMLPDVAPITQNRTYTVDINEPGAIASDTGWA